MRRPKYFYVVTLHNAECWIDSFNKNQYLEHIGTRYWPYTRDAARKELKSFPDGANIFQFALPFNNFIKQVK